MSYHSLLPFRPTNVVHHLGTANRVPLLSGRHLLEGTGETGGALWIPRVSHPSAVLALFRAATHHKSLIGFALVPESVEPQVLRKDYSPSAFLHSVVDAAQALEQAPPFLLHVQEPPVEQPQGPQFDAVLEHITNSLEVGFTSFGIDLSACREADCPALAAGLLGPVVEMELSVVVRLGGMSDFAPTVSDRAYQIGKTVAALDKAGVRPNLVVLPGPDELSADAWQLAEECSAMIAPIAIGWKDSREAETRAGGIIRALIAGRRIARMAPDGREPVDTQKLEALAYMEAVDLLEKLGGRRSAQRLLQSMAP